jgi:hypothetical protein
MNSMKHVLCYSLFLVCFNTFSQSDSTAVSNTVTAGSKPAVALTDSMMINNIPDSLKKETPKHVFEFISVEAGLGLTLPLGNFASGDYHNVLAGYAKEGFSMGANVYVKVHHNVNVMLAYSRTMNTFDEVSFGRNALSGTKDYTLITRSNWVSNFLLVGGSGMIPLDEENYLTPRLLLGLCINKSPSYETAPTGTKSVGSPTTVDSRREVQFAFRIGVGLRKYINKMFYLSLNPDFYRTTLKNNINKPYFTGNPATYQSISIFNLNVGVGFRMY